MLATGSVSTKHVPILLTRGWWIATIRESTFVESYRRIGEGRHLENSEPDSPQRPSLSHQRAENPAIDVTNDITCVIECFNYVFSEYTHRRLQLLLQLAAVMTTQSQNQLVLFFLIEGNLRPSSISVPYYHSDGRPVTIDDLRKGIFECGCKNLAGNIKISP